MSYKNIVYIYSAQGKTFANTTERINQHGSRFYCTYDITGKNWSEGDQIDNSEFDNLPLMASTDSPYKKPLKKFKREVTNGKKEPIMEISERIELQGVYFSQNNLTYSAVYIDSDNAHYTLSQYIDEMPSHHDENFDNINDLIGAMKEIAPLKFWRNRENV